MDLSIQNPYRNSFPDWEEQFFNSGLKLVLKNPSISRKESGLYEARVQVIFLQGEKVENQFEGLIYIKEEKTFKIIRVEI